MLDITSWKVLVVEDEADSMDVVTDILEYHNIETLGVKSAEEALSTLETFQPTLIIIDLALPEMDGWQLLARLRSNPATASIPAVAMTTFHSVNVAQEAIKAGFNAYFPKPIEAMPFVRELERVLKEYRH